MIELHGVTKTYRKGGREIRAADAVTCRADAGDLVVVQGPSGSGKSTLLLMMGGMLPPDAGRVQYGGDNVYAWPARRRNRYRKHTVGFVFQRFFLIPYLTVFDNIRMPLALQGGRADRARGVQALAERLRIADRLGHRPAELSAGEQQRAAVARALTGSQELILADEPTGNLDADNVALIGCCLVEESRRGRTVVLATHNVELLKIGTQRLHLERGKLVGAAADGADAEQQKGSLPCDG